MVKVDSYSTSPADDHPARPRMCVIKNHPTCVHDPSIQEFRSRQAHCMPEPCLLVCWFDCSFACLLLVCHWGLRSFKICKNHCFFFLLCQFSYIRQCTKLFRFITDFVEDIDFRSLLARFGVHLGVHFGVQSRFKIDAKNDVKKSCENL